MAKFRDEFKTTVGYSDHTEEMEALILAVAMQAQILEFHFTDTKKGKTFRDHKVSLTNSDIETLVERIQKVMSIFGNSKKQPTKSELEAKHNISFRRAIYPVREIFKGEVVTKEDFIALRPNHGLDARNLNDILNKKAICNLKKMQPLEVNMFRD